LFYQTLDYIIQNFDKNIKILDVGAGIGTYFDLLSPHGYVNIDCVEIYEPYIRNFDLENKYQNVFLGDVCELNINFSDYDLIIIGDVLEHIDVLSARNLLNKITNSFVIVAVPFESEQGEHFGNVYETHLQPDLTLYSFLTTYNGYYPLCVRYDYAIFINQEINTVLFENEERELPENYKEVIKSFFNQVNFENIKKDDLMKYENKNVSKTTIVTGLWDLGRKNIDVSFARSYDTYLAKFSELLKTDVNMYIFISPEDEEFIWQHRKKENTIVNKMTIEELKTWFNFTEKTNEIRKKESWLNQASWLSNSPQATLETYNPVVMSKMFMLNNVTIWNPFASDYFFWIDAGITSTVHYGYFTHDKVFDKLPNFIDQHKDFVFLTYPYEGGNEIHGFDREAIAKFSNTDYVKFVCRGGFFGGKKNTINDLNGLYYHYLNNSLTEGFMGTEESIFTIMMYNHPEIITQFMIGQDGLIWRFFEDIKDNNFLERVVNSQIRTLDKKNTALYIITFNSPNQLQTLINSMLEYDEDFVFKPQLILLDNSTDLSTQPKYVEICEKYNITHIKKDNLGICGGRQFIAEHAEENGFDFYFFFEDDMFFYPKKGDVCKNGFNRWVDKLYSRSLDIISNNAFDFLKLSFTEFFGDNKTQWSWYNVPQSVREELWPEKPKLPVQGLDPNAPKTNFKNINSIGDLPYIDGEIYYSNWPQVVSREGNKKMFLETKWAHPYEQTWMSYIYQETKKGKIKPAILLLTPTEHNRFDHYDRELRKES